MPLSEEKRREMTMLEPQAEAPAETGEIDTLARKLAAAYVDRVEQYMALRGLSLQEAAAKAQEATLLSRISAISKVPLEEVTWAELGELNTWGPEMALHRGQEVKQAALESVRSGDCAAAYLAGREPRLWLRAVFLAIRKELTDGWQSRNGIEQQLIDMAAQAQLGVFYWQQQALDAICLGNAAEAAAMVDRYVRMFTRLLRSLCDLRKAPLAVVVQNLNGQVNVAGQQVNTHNGDGHTQGMRRRSAGKAGACTCPVDRVVSIGECR
jgi:hypothetical protein